MTYRLKEIVCEAMLITSETTDQELYDFGVQYAERAQDGSGMNLGMFSPNAEAFVPSNTDTYLLKCTTPLFGTNRLFELVSPTDLAARYDSLA